MRDQMQPGSGVRTIGGMYARVKEVHDDTVLLEVAPGVHAVFTKNAIGAVLAEEEYDRLVNNDVPLTFDDAPAGGEDGGAGDSGGKVDLGKAKAADDEGGTDAHETSADEHDETVAATAQDVRDAGKK